MSNESRVAIVTGGTRGIGLAISKALIADGHKVAALYFGNNKAANDFEQESGGKGKAYKVDVSDFDACQKSYQEIEDDLGNVDIVVNNAGITRDRMLHKMSKEDWEQVIDTNLTSCYNLCRVAIPNMRERSYGRIVNIGSINV